MNLDTIGITTFNNIFNTPHTTVYCDECVKYWVLCPTVNIYYDRQICEYLLI